MKRFQIILGLLALINVISILVSSAVIGVMSASLPSQNAVSRWAGDGTATAQISAFLTDSAELSSDDISRGITGKLDSALTEASISPPDADARLYALGYSTETSGSVTYVNTSGKNVGGAISVTVTACGGDFFIFHPLSMLSGYYFNTEDILNDCVVIDNDIAWQIFGSHDVVGRVIKLNGRDCYISGVTECGRDGKYSDYYGDKPRIYISYSLAEELYGNLPARVVEILLPNPIGGFAMDMFKDALSVPESECELVENSARFSDSQLRRLLSGFSERSVRTTNVSFPYYENTARVLNDKASIVYIFKLVPICMLVVIAVIEIVTVYINRRRIFKALSNRLKRRKYK